MIDKFCVFVVKYIWAFLDTSANGFIRKSRLVKIKMLYYMVDF